MFQIKEEVTDCNADTPKLNVIKTEPIDIVDGTHHIELLPTIEPGQLQYEDIKCNFKEESGEIYEKVLKPNSTESNWVNDVPEHSQMLPTVKLELEPEVLVHETEYPVVQFEEGNECNKNLGEEEELVRQDNYRGLNFIKSQEEHPNENKDSNINIFAYSNILYNEPSQNSNSKKQSTENLPFPCEVCEKRFAQKSLLKRHMITHTNDRPHSCDVCGKHFLLKYHLTAHKTIHSNDRPYSCDVCNKSFSQKGVLRRHKRLHTNDHPFSCEVCGKSFLQRYHLKTHMHYHSGATPFACDVCGKSFCEKSILNRHALIHSADYQYCCDLCGKSFTQKSSLNTHIRIHDGNRPYSCEVCGKSFSRKHHLDRHAPTHW